MNKSRAIALADRSAMLSLRFMTALNLLFLIAFLIMIAFAAGKSHAEATAIYAAHVPAALDTGPAVDFP